MNKVFEKILEKLDEASVLRANSKEYFNNPQNGEYVDDVVLMKDAIKIVNDVAEEFNGGWIPCSERLPKYGEVVMCSCTNGGITISCITHKGVTPSKSVRFGQHSVIAWQPLPEPYKERD